MESKNEMNTEEVAVQYDKGSIESLINDLSSNNGIARVRARQALVTIGGGTVAALSNALEGQNEEQRWEAAKALGQIGDPAAVGVLVKTLEDKIFDLRWLAAEGLITIGKPSIVPLLHSLLEHSDSVYVREGAHHVFHDLHDQNLKAILRPILDALEDTEKQIELPFATEAALKSLE